MKKLIFVIVTVVIIILADVIFISVKNHSIQQQMKDSHPLTLFYSTQCPHCDEVEVFIKKNKIMKKIDIQQKEISDRKNLNLLIKTAKKCHIDMDFLGVPLLWDGSKCFVGPKGIIDYLHQSVHDE